MPPPATSRAATSQATVTRWVSPAGTRPGSSPSMPIRYGRSTSAREPIATRLSTRTAVERVRRAIRRPAIGMARKAARAA
nr:hypothetical protein [Acrocarpospora catenulata]